MRYYVIAVQHNKLADAENRSVPKAYNDLISAKQEAYRQLSVDMGNQTLDWGVVSILTSDGYLVQPSEKWERPVEPIESEDENA